MRGDLKSKMKSMQKRARSDFGIDKRPLKGLRGIIIEGELEHGVATTVLE